MSKNKNLYYNELKEEVLKTESYIRVTDYTKEQYKVKEYYKIGEILSKAGKEYGKDIIGTYSEKLMIEVGKKYNVRTLRRFRQFYEIFSSNSKWSTVSTTLTWSHISELLSLDNINKINYYINITKDNNLSVRELRERIKSHEYERLPNKTKEKLIKSEKLEIPDLVPNPIVIKTDKAYDKITEYDLKNMILHNIDDFLRSFGNGFTYVGNEYKIKIGNRYNYIDILLFNVIHDCYIVVELKVTELKKEHIGQIETYMNYVDKNIKEITQNKTVGIIICKKDNKFVMEYCSNERIFSKEYLIMGENVI